MCVCVFLMFLMFLKITTFCETNNHYIPRGSELCLALYADEWYRGVCLSPRHSPTTSIIFFVDFGNTEIVNHKDIRLMPKDFITPCALANICNVVSKYIILITNYNILIITVIVNFNNIIYNNIILQTLHLLTVMDNILLK